MASRASELPTFRERTAPEEGRGLVCVPGSGVRSAAGIGDALYETRTTNPIEDLNGLIGYYTRNVKRWRDGQMVLRRSATSLNQAGRGFRAVFF